jgi:hypothetical protein
MTLPGIIIPSSRLIHKRVVGHHYSRNFLMRIIKTSLNWSGSGLAVSQGMKQTSFKCESRGKRWIHHAKHVGRNQYRGGGCKGWTIRNSLSTRLVTPSRSNRIRLGVKRRNSSNGRSHLRDMSTTKQEWSMWRSCAPKSNARIRANHCDGV